MVIFFVTPTYRPSFFSGKRGGGEISNFILLSGLAAKGHRIYVISMSPVIGKNIYRDNKLIVIEFFSSTLGFSLSKALSFIFFRPFLKSIISRTKPGVILASTSVIQSSAKVAENNDIKIGGIVRAMENLPGHGWDVDLTSLKSMFKYFVHKATIGWPGGQELKVVDFIIVNSEFLKRKYQTQFPYKKFYVVYPALATVKSSLNLPSVVSRVMMVGATEGKGVLLFKEIANKFLQLEFHIIGDPNVQPKEVVVSNNIYTHGWHDKPVEIIDSMDLVLVPSQLEEAFGRISLEAISRKKFVLVSDRGGLPETVNYENKLIIKSDCLNSWVERINWLIEKPEKFKNAMLRASVSSSQFEQNAQVNNIEKVLKNNYI